MCISAGDAELDQLRRRLRETELAMERIVEQMAKVPLKMQQVRQQYLQTQFFIHTLLLIIILFIIFSPPDPHYRQLLLFWLIFISNFIICMCYFLFLFIFNKNKSNKTMGPRLVRVENGAEKHYYLFFLYYYVKRLFLFFNLSIFVVVNAMSALLDEVDQEIEARKKASDVTNQVTVSVTSKLYRN